MEVIKAVSLPVTGQALWRTQGPPAGKPLHLLFALCLNDPAVSSQVLPAEEPRPARSFASALAAPNAAPKGCFGMLGSLAWLFWIIISAAANDAWPLQNSNLGNSDTSNFLPQRFARYNFLANILHSSPGFQLPPNQGELSWAWTPLQRAQSVSRGHLQAIITTLSY